MGVIGFWCFASWFLWARKWFTGPIRQVEAELAGVNVDDPAALDQAEKEGRVPHHELGRDGRKSFLEEMNENFE